jgi:hypothetical protein
LTEAAPLPLSIAANGPQSRSATTGADDSQDPVPPHGCRMLPILSGFGVMAAVVMCAILSGFGVIVAVALYALLVLRSAT